MNDITLQINLCAGDIRYAEISLPELVRSHNAIREVLLVVDCTKPQKTNVIDPVKMFPEPAFSQRVEQIRSIAHRLKDSGIASELCFLEPGSRFINELAAKYLHRHFPRTHDHRGIANIPYWAGIEVAKTRYVVHYDGDMLIWQQAGYEWTHEAIERLQHLPHVVAAIPRNAPPSPQHPDLPTLHQGRPFTSHEGYWLNDWFGTRAFLIDKQRLDPYLPLLTGKYYVESLLRKILNRHYPLAAEQAMFRKIGKHGGARMILKTTNAFTLHPPEKGDRYIRLLPNMLEFIRQGIVPPEQQGWEEVNLDAWESMIERAAQAEIR